MGWPGGNVNVITGPRGSVVVVAAVFFTAPPVSTQCESFN